MTSRLKRKLGDIGVDPSSARANENFCLVSIGTPLPPLEKSRDTGEFVPLWKQEVRDEKGRRRLHGAFTGGFSAGYFNTVGSKEGWTPQTFVSSRSDRAKKKVAKPEDFMDEEDLQDIRDSRKIVDTTDEMDFSTGKQPEVQDDPDADPLTAALRTAMLPPTNDSVGARILKKMGWRVGQGIGPRVTLKQRRLQDLKASTSTGYHLPQTAPDIAVDEDSEEANKHTYAPRDTPILIVERKDNSHGLGYQPGMSLNDSLGVKGSSGRPGPNISSGFGLGALNDADEDDLDVYDSGSANVRNRLAYDGTDDHDRERSSLGGSKSKSVSGPTLSSGKFRDGGAVLPGFVLSDKPVMEDRWYPLPDIPPGWKPDPKRVWSQSQPQEPAPSANKENIKNDATTALPHGKWKTSGLSADEVSHTFSNSNPTKPFTRGSILGETPLPAAPRSVFDFMSQKDRERLKNIAASLHPPSTGEPSTATEAASQSSLTPTPTTATPRIPRIDPGIARAAINGFKPFSTNPVKQARYTAYLQSQADPSSTITLEPLSNQSIPEFNSEMDEYAQSAIVFKPMSGAMAGRFTTAAVVEHGPKVIEGLHTPAFKDEPPQDDNAATADKGKETKDEKELSPKENAARLGMYGPLTRESVLWQPARLLCKRFGVKDPNPEPKPEDPTTQPSASYTQDPSSSDTAMAQDVSAADYGIVTTTEASRSTSTGGPRDLANVGLGDEDDTQGRDTLTYERPSIDIFKAIFASDDEDSSDEEGDQTVDGEPDLPITTNSNITVAPIVATVTENQPVDPNTFKPTFVKREARTTKTDSERQEKKDKKEKRKEKRKAIVSFMDEDDAGESLKLVVEKPKKKRKKDKEKEKEKIKETPESAPRGRKRAIDYM
ncbi:hypothetical protein F5878DRAFT_535694 [Lentinula raphanica]|uniref:G-patch domain-containing protein n=1 Tax=Lentinula raphanica TaxID=153919 RepID=A0AA38UFN4_9AGAR|nr:hypothetical protein F5878DRAFT_535694 [Lentinula raphanica]